MVRGSKVQAKFMSRIVGIDLGTTNSLVATVDSGIPIVIADAEGHRLTPSVVHVPAANAASVVGHAANRVRVVKPAETVYSVKRFVGRRGSDISLEQMLVTYPVKGAGAGPVTFDIHGRSLTPEEISAEILKKLKRDAEACFGEPVVRAVITVPVETQTQNAREAQHTIVYIENFFDELRRKAPTGK